MTVFDDFDAWAEAISGASLRLACDAVETPTWRLGTLDLGTIVLQLGVEGGGNLCYGGNTHTGPLLFIPLSHASGHVVNGEALDDNSLLAIPRGADFSIRFRRRAHAWCSVALPDGVLLAGDALSGSRRVCCPSGSLRALRRLVRDVTSSLLDRPAGTLAHRSAAIDVLHASIACLTDAALAPRPSTGRPRLDRAAIVRRAMAEIDATPAVPTAAELARRVAVHDRTLLRTFQETFGVPPKKYLLLRQLHRIHRVLAGEPADGATVADVLVRHGIWEFGRFAGRYRRHFGELPSETLARARR